MKSQLPPPERPFDTQNRSMIAGFALAAGLFMSTIAVVFAFRAFDADEAQRFNEATQEIHDDLQARLDFFVSSVRQLAAVYAINPDLTQEQFVDFTYTTGIRAKDAGIYSYGIFRRVPSSQGDRYYIWLRELGPHAPTTLLPVRSEISSGDQRIPLYKEAIDSAEPLLATNVPALIATQSPGQMMMVAAYKNIRIPTSLAARRENAIGIAYARFSESGLFDQVLQGAGPFKANLHLEVLEGSGPSLAASKNSKPIYIHSVGTETVADPLVRKSDFEVAVGGRVFTVKVYSPQPLFKSLAALIAGSILILGVALSLLFFRIVLSRERRTLRLHFLEDVSSLLSTTLDTSVVAETLTKKLLGLCDWCVIELLDEDGATQKHLYAASSPDRLERLKDFYISYPPGKSQRRLTLKARETRHTQIISKVTKESLSEAIQDPVRAQRLLDVGFKSMLVTPLIGGERILGTLALYSGDPKRRYNEEHASLVEDIAARSSIALENAHLYSESQNLNRAKDHFLAMLSHELRTPMNVILGWLEILMTEDVDKETYDQALETLNRNAKVQIQLINDLLDVSRIINGKLSLMAVPAQLGAIVNGAFDSVKPAARAKSIECSVEIDGNLDCTVDPERIQQVLWNLLSNATKFTPAGGRIDLKAQGRAGEIEISVRDSGLGIEPEFLPYVFDRFRQEEVGFTRSQGGLGLGLSIVRYLVEGHGGTITVNSEGRGHGSTFTVILPRVAVINEESQLHTD